MDKSIQQMKQDLAHAEYSPSTQGQYIKTIEALGGYYDRPVADLRRDDLRAYVEYLRGQGRSASWLKKYRHTASRARSARPGTTSGGFRNPAARIGTGTAVL